MLILPGCEFIKSEGVVEMNKDFESISSKNNQFGFELLMNLDGGEENNIFISPISAYIALSMLLSGADGKTKKEIEEILNVKNIDIEQFYETSKSILMHLQRDSDQIEVKIGNSLWINDFFQFQETFKRNAKDYFNGEIYEIDMRNKRSLTKINNWVADTTNGKIDQIIDGPLDESIIAYIINAVYFNGNWKYAFQKNQTKQATFHPADGSNLQAKFMQLKEKLPYYETEKYQAVQLPYSDGEMSMNIFLPKQGGLADIVNHLAASDWDVLIKKFRKKEGTVLLPKFELSYETSLLATLQKMGLKDAFDKSLADFSQMIVSDERIFISDMKQQTYIDVHEKGTEAAGVTSTEMKLTAAPADQPFYMDINQPFLIVIMDHETDVILFLGTISHPKS